MKVKALFWSYTIDYCLQQLQLALAAKPSLFLTCNADTSIHPFPCGPTHLSCYNPLQFRRYWQYLNSFCLSCSLGPYISTERLKTGTLKHIYLPNTSLNVPWLIHTGLFLCQGTSERSYNERRTSLHSCNSITSDKRDTCQGMCDKYCEKELSGVGSARKKPNFFSKCVFPLVLRSWNEWVGQSLQVVFVRAQGDTEIGFLPGVGELWIERARSLPCGKHNCDPYWPVFWIPFS